MIIDCVFCHGLIFQLEYMPATRERTAMILCRCQACGKAMVLRETGTAPQLEGLKP